MSVGFRVTPMGRVMSVRLWEGGQLLDLDLLRSDRDAPFVKCRLSNFPQFLSVVSRNPENNSCGGVGVEVMIEHLVVKSECAIL